MQADAVTRHAWGSQLQSFLRDQRGTKNMRTGGDLWQALLTNPTGRVIQGLDEVVTNLTHQLGEAPEGVSLRKL